MCGMRVNAGFENQMKMTSAWNQSSMLLTGSNLPYVR